MWKQSMCLCWRKLLSGLKDKPNLYMIITSPPQESRSFSYNKMNGKKMGVSPVSEQSPTQKSNLLIMTVAMVTYLGGWRRGLRGREPFPDGVLMACRALLLSVFTQEQEKKGIMKFMKSHHILCTLCARKTVSNNIPAGRVDLLNLLTESLGLVKVKGIQEYLQNNKNIHRTWLKPWISS